MYIEIDVHKDSCYLTAMDEEGKVAWEKEVRTNELIEAMEKGSRIAMEAGTYSRPLYNELRKRGFDVYMKEQQLLLFQGM